MACSVKKRYILVALIHYATFCLYSLRVNLSVAIVSMVNQTYANTKKTSIKECGGDSSNSTMNVSSQVSLIINTLCIQLIYVFYKIFLKFFKQKQRMR